MNAQTTIFLFATVLNHHFPFSFQSRHLALIERVQRSMSLLQSSLLMAPPTVVPQNFATSTPKNSRAGRRSRRPLSERAIRIMEKWYADNQEHPYPSYDSCEVCSSFFYKFNFRLPGS